MNFYCFFDVKIIYLRPPNTPPVFVPALVLELELEPNVLVDEPDDLPVVEDVLELVLEPNDLPPPNEPLAPWNDPNLYPV